MLKKIRKLYICLILSGLSILATQTGYAENEPTDNTSDGASTLELNAVATGFISNSDTDFYKITNSGGFSTIKIEFTFSGSGPDYHKFRVYGPNSTSTILSNQQTATGIAPRYYATYTIQDGPAGAAYYIELVGQSSGGNNSYTLSVLATKATISPTTATVANTESSYPITVTSTKTWDVLNVPAWITVDPMTATGNKEVTVTVMANNFLPRTGEFTIGGAVHTVTQDGLPASTENEPTDNTTDGATPMLINSNATGRISNSDKDYYKITNSGGASSIVISYSFEGSGSDQTKLAVMGPNGTTELSNQFTSSGSAPKYFATYTIESAVKDAFYYIGVLGSSTDGNKSYTLTVTAPTTLLSISQYDAPASGDFYGINVISNTDWTVTGVPDWAEATKTSGSGDDIVEITVFENKLPSVREATISIGGVSHMISQAGAPADSFLATTSAGDNPLYRISGYFVWSEGTGFLYDGFWPFVYDFGAENWIYVFADGASELTGFYLYDFGKGQFGFTSALSYPWYYSLNGTDAVQFGH